jgi:predicted N-formylglutamate amidohydrolase
MGQALARALRAPLISSRTTRLLVDLNRTEDNRRFSEFTRSLLPSQRQEILELYYEPHWTLAEAALRSVLGRPEGGSVLHVASHSFTATPGKIGHLRPDRDFEVGLLYDPRMRRERDFAFAWKRAILARDPELRVRLNQPYRGWTDGMPRAFRGKLGVRYIGVELECNQASLARPEMATRLRRVLISSLQETAPLVTIGA